MTLTLAQAFYIPPATGFRSDMSSEFKVLNQAGVSTTLIDVLALCPSLKSMQRGLSSPEGELEFWRKCCEELTSFLEIHAVKNLPLVLAGFNFGGSLAAYLATNLPVNALIASGSVPRLSDFWENSDHPVARNSRETHSPMDPRFSQITRHLDLTESVLK
jgi:hypothetical protein